MTEIGSMFSRFYDRSFLRVISGRKFLRVCSMAITLMGVLVFSTSALRAQEYTAQEIIDSGHKFFGATSGGLATVVEKIFASYGLPNGYLLGEEGSGALIGGLTYGEGTLYTKNAGDHKVFWQGPSLGWDFGGEGSRVMMLVYNLDDVSNLYNRYGGVAGSAYVVAGVGFNVLKNNNVLLVPIRTGVGARLGVNLGYLKLTERATWNPF
ncbi:mll2811 [Mesorhizobium japonicum MAFF 303099]|uniref:Mll2811 protein n=6 Tax=Phyllobacteriaceae TaxID=69277 RepID=Q98HL9_RHILO|nr:mll2811 [Mesorhizobium japonicum MAFF 303099]